jgi:Asp/Glu/hydantoin racemase
MSYKIGLIRVLTTKKTEILLSHQKIIQNNFPEFEIETKCIQDQFEGIHDEKTLNIAFPKIVKLAKEWEKNIDGLIISCAGDPAVEHLRKILSVPVVGAGVSAACMSLNFGKKVGIIGIEQYPPKSYEEILKDRLFAYELPEGVVTTNDLQTDQGRESITNSAKNLKSIGCDVITFACTGLSTTGAATLLKDIGLPVVDAVMAEGAMMKFMLMEKNKKVVDRNV